MDSTLKQLSQKTRQYALQESHREVLKGFVYQYVPNINDDELDFDCFEDCEFDVEWPSEKQLEYKFPSYRWIKLKGISYKNLYN